jgi:hypothetical protein
MLDKRRSTDTDWRARQVLALKSRFGWREGSLAVLIGRIVAVLAIGRVAWADENFQAVQGIGVYFGVLPAAIVGGHRSGTLKVPCTGARLRVRISTILWSRCSM